MRLIFFFKQKTAYEMRISDWSSDVCSSDLLALALITRDAPHLLILDEPTNHLDVDAREALVQALNDYTGAVLMVSHDRHMLEMTADRLVLVEQGTAREFGGSQGEYIAQVMTGDSKIEDKARGRKGVEVLGKHWGRA